MKKILATLIAFVLSTGVSFGGDHEANIIVVTHGSDTDAFWGVVRNGVEAAKGRHRCRCSIQKPTNWRLKRNGIFD